MSDAFDPYRTEEVEESDNIRLIGPDQRTIGFYERDSAEGLARMLNKAFLAGQKREQGVDTQPPPREDLIAFPVKDIEYELHHTMYETLVMLGAPKEIADLQKKFLDRSVTKADIYKLRGYNISLIDGLKTRLNNGNFITVRVGEIPEDDEPDFEDPDSDEIEFTD